MTWRPDRLAPGPAVRSGSGRAPLDAAEGAVRSLRVSVTDRCTLRCRYCMPAEGLPWLPSEDVLTDEEIVRVVAIAVQRLGVRDVRFTGGEPLLRPGLEDIVAGVAAVRADDGTSPRLALTTNGLGLARRAAGLAAAGLHRVNVSLDSLDRQRYADVARRDRLADVLAGLEAARRAGLSPIKVNTVLVRGVNDDEGPRLLRWALREGYELRFIEQMPLGPPGAWDPEQVVTAPEILARLTAEFRLTPVPESRRGSAPARTWRVDGSDAVVGVIASVSWPFCQACDRIRLTADGYLRSCLFGQTEHDIRTPMRAGADDEELAGILSACVRTKTRSHGIGGEGFVQPARPMSAIGG